MLIHFYLVYVRHFLNTIVFWSFLTPPLAQRPWQPASSPMVAPALPVTFETETRKNGSRDSTETKSRDSPSLIQSKAPLRKITISVE